MKNIRWIKNSRVGSVLLVSLIGASGLNAQFETREEKETFYLSLAKEHSKDSFEILHSIHGIRDFSFWASGTTRMDLLRDFGTVVHESCHSFNHNKGSYGAQSYFVGDGISIFVKKGKVFNSRELNKVVPKKVRKKIFRYKTYVGGDDEKISSQSEYLEKN